jgi:predicted PurR-regulated permease PerM
MAENRQIRWILKLLKAAAALLLLWLGLKYLLGLVLPFLLSLLLARLIEPAVRAATERLHIRRGFVSPACCLLLTGVLLALLWLAASRGLSGISALAEELPGMLRGVTGLVSRLRDRVYGYIVAAPPEVQESLTSAVSGLADRLSAMPGELMARLMSVAPTVLSHAPGLVLSVVTFFISLFFISASYPDIAAFLARQVPEERRLALRNVKGDVLGVCARWLRAECILSP